MMREGWGMSGKHHTPATREKQRTSHLGQNLSEIHKPDCQCCVCKAKRSETKGKENSFFGRHHTQENIERNKLFHLGKKQSPETIERRRISLLIYRMEHPGFWLGKHRSPETIERLKAHRGEGHGNFGNHRSKETRDQMSLLGKLRWQNSEYRENQIASIVKNSHIRPTQPELQLGKLLDKLFPGEYKYVGNGEVIIAGKNPDFINVNGKKKIIEMWGSYWHKGEKPQTRVDVFSPYGYETLIIWEEALKNKHELEKRLREFHNT